MEQTSTRPPTVMPPQPQTSSLPPLVPAQRTIRTRYYKANPNPNSFVHLHAITLTSATGTLTFETLSQLIQTDLPYWIPSVWPTPIPQRGHCCGLYALEMALRYAYPYAPVPPARKDGAPFFQSLRQIAKEMGFSAFGEIFDAVYLEKIATLCGFFQPDAKKLTSLHPRAYQDQLCSFLHHGNTVIVSCDLGGPHDTPSRDFGLASHWALVFGYFFLNNNCHFLVTQYGQYYIWSAKKLYESNLYLPKMNPKRGPFYFYYKDPKIKEEYFIKTDKKLPPEILKAARYCKATTLTEFQFSALVTPTRALNHSLTLDVKEAKDDSSSLESPYPGLTKNSLQFT